jgi:hypothetical protein
MIVALLGAFDRWLLWIIPTPLLGPLHDFSMQVASLTIFLSRRRTKRTNGTLIFANFR